MVDRLKVLQRIVGARYVTDDITVDASCCVTLRHRRATCQRCVEICPAQAIQIDQSQLTIDHSACTHCGACVTVCPAQALQSSWTPWSQLLKDMASSVQATEGRPMVSCAEVLAGLDSQDDYDRDKVVEVQCLEIVDEALLLAAMAMGANEVRLVHGDCLLCQRGCMGAAWSLVVDYARSMLDALQVDRAITDDTALPDDAFDIAHSTLANNQIDRRSLLTNAKDEALALASTAMDELLEESRFRGVAASLGLTAPDAPLANASRGKVCEWALGALAIQRYGDAPKAVQALRGRSMHSRLFSDVLIDSQTCVNCFLCAAYCHQHAIEKLMEGRRVMGFNIHPYLCDQCGACINACRPDALQLTNSIDVVQLLREQDTHITYAQWDAQEAGASGACDELS